MRPFSPVFIDGERAAMRELRTEELKKARTHPAADNLLRPGDTGEIDRWTEQVSGHVANTGGVLPPRADAWRRHERTWRNLPTARIHEHDQSAGVGVRQRFQEHRGE